MSHTPDRGWTSTPGRVRFASVERYVIRGGDATSGRKLYGHFRQARIADPHLSVVQLVHAVGEAKAIRLLTIEAIADQVLAAGLASQAKPS